MGGHPFAIYKGSSGTVDVSGLVHFADDKLITVGTSAQGQISGTLFWDIPRDYFGEYRYQCTSHAGMKGTINVKALSNKIDTTDISGDRIVATQNLTAEMATINSLTVGGDLVEITLCCMILA